MRVEAKAPSGRAHEMAIGESNGVYTANFTPTEVGESVKDKHLNYEREVEIQDR